MVKRKRLSIPTVRAMHTRGFEALRQTPGISFRPLQLNCEGFEEHVLIIKSQTVLIKYYESDLVIISIILLFIPQVLFSVSIICFSGHLSACDCHDRGTTLVAKLTSLKATCVGQY